tara:strand:- start:13951 stop:17622 length:3672 start_codon:yes stop_codon:yes gene_type:complete
MENKCKNAYLSDLAKRDSNIVKNSSTYFHIRRGKTLKVDKDEILVIQRHEIFLINKQTALVNHGVIYNYGTIIVRRRGTLINEESGKFYIVGARLRLEGVQARNKGYMFLLYNTMRASKWRGNYYSKHRGTNPGGHLYSWAYRRAIQSVKGGRIKSISGAKGFDKVNGYFNKKVANEYENNYPGKLCMVKKCREVISKVYKYDKEEENFIKSKRETWKYELATRIQPMLSGDIRTLIGKLSSAHSPNGFVDKHYGISEKSWGLEKAQKIFLNIPKTTTRTITYKTKLGPMAVHYQSRSNPNNITSSQYLDQNPFLKENGKWQNNMNETYVAKLREFINNVMNIASKYKIQPLLKYVGFTDAYVITLSHKDKPNSFLNIVYPYPIMDMVFPEIVPTPVKVCGNDSPPINQTRPLPDDPPRIPKNYMSKKASPDETACHIMKRPFLSIPKKIPGRVYVDRTTLLNRNMVMNHQDKTISEFYDYPGLKKFLSNEKLLVITKRLFKDTNHNPNGTPGKYEIYRKQTFRGKNGRKVDVVFALMSNPNNVSIQDFYKNNPDYKKKNETSKAMSYYEKNIVGVVNKCHKSGIFYLDKSLSKIYVLVYGTAFPPYYHILVDPLQAGGFPIIRCQQPSVETRDVKICSDTEIKPPTSMSSISEVATPLEDSYTPESVKAQPTHVFQKLIRPLAYGSSSLTMYTQSETYFFNDMASNQRPMSIEVNLPVFKGMHRFFYPRTDGNNIDDNSIEKTALTLPKDLKSMKIVVTPTAVGVYSNIPVVPNSKKNQDGFYTVTSIDNKATSSTVASMEVSRLDTVFNKPFVVFRFWDAPRPPPTVGKTEWAYGEEVSLPFPGTTIKMAMYGSFNVETYQFDLSKQTDNVKTLQQEKKGIFMVNSKTLPIKDSETTKKLYIEYEYKGKTYTPRIIKIYKRSLEQESRPPPRTALDDGKMPMTWETDKINLTHEERKSFYNLYNQMQNYRSPEYPNFQKSYLDFAGRRVEYKNNPPRYTKDLDRVMDSGVISNDRLEDRGNLELLYRNYVSKRKTFYDAVNSGEKVTKNSAVYQEYLKAGNKFAKASVNVSQDNSADRGASRDIIEARRAMARRIRPTVMAFYNELRRIDALVPEHGLIARNMIVSNVHSKSVRYRYILALLPTVAVVMLAIRMLLYPETKLTSFYIIIMIVSLFVIIDFLVSSAFYYTYKYNVNSGSGFGSKMLQLVTGPSSSFYGGYYN